MGRVIWRANEATDSRRNVAFEIELSEEPLGKVSEALHNLPSMKNLPLGVRQANLGDAEVMGELFVSFGFAMPAGGAMHLYCAGAAVQGCAATCNHPRRAPLVIGRRNRGMSSLEALKDACHKRARPIVMTTIVMTTNAMGAGMLPIALGHGMADLSFRSPMATAVIGGLITSTLLGLLVIPVVYA